MDITQKGLSVFGMVSEEYPPEINKLLELLSPFVVRLKEQIKKEIEAELLGQSLDVRKISTPAIISDWHHGPFDDEAVPVTQPVVLPGIVPVKIPEAPPVAPLTPTPEPVDDITDPVPCTAPWTQPGDPPPPAPPTPKKRGRKPKKVKAPKPPWKGGRPATSKSDTESTWYKCRKSWAQANLLQKKRGLPPIPKAEFEAAYYLKHPPETGQIPKTEPVVPAPLEDG